MTVKEWREQNQDADYTMVFASDAGGFGRKGEVVSGSHEVTGRLEVVDIETRVDTFPTPHDFTVLHVWDAVVCQALH